MWGLSVAEFSRCHLTGRNELLSAHNLLYLRISNIYIPQFMKVGSNFQSVSRLLLAARRDIIRSSNQARLTMDRVPQRLSRDLIIIEAENWRLSSRDSDKWTAVRTPAVQEPLSAVQGDRERS